MNAGRRDRDEEDSVENISIGIVYRGFRDLRYDVRNLGQEIKVLAEVVIQLKAQETLARLLKIEENMTALIARNSARIDALEDFRIQSITSVWVIRALSATLAALGAWVISTFWRHSP